MKFMLIVSMVILSAFFGKMSSFNFADLNTLEGVLVAITFVSGVMLYFTKNEINKSGWSQNSNLVFRISATILLWAITVAYIPHFIEVFTSALTIGLTCVSLIILAFWLVRDENTLKTA